MQSHARFVAVLFVVWGALTTIVGLSTFALGVAAAALFASADRDGGQLAAGLTAATLMTLAVFAIIWGLAHVAIGMPLRRRRHWSRLGALMLSAVDLALPPYGTALGAYAMWVLLSEDGKRLFAVPSDV
jgi:hypothetical protein